MNSNEKELTAMGRKYKMGDIHPTDDNLIFWSYPKKGGEYWITKEQFIRWRGHDGYWSVYFLPKENYYGASQRVTHRIRDHIKNGKDTTDWFVVKTFETKKEAFDYEKELQITNNGNGYVFTKEWRKRSSEWLKINGHEKIYSKRIKKVVCVETGQIFKSVSDCEIFYAGKRCGNLSRHLKAKAKQRRFYGLTFKFVA